jgi:hypothetical protein
MKCCSYCGKEYAEETTVCTLDGHPVKEKEANQTKTLTQPVSAETAFNAILISPISSAGTYGVFNRRSELLFIQIEGGVKSSLAALAPLLGPAGGLIPLVLWLFAKKREKGRLQNIDQQNPEDLLRENDSNFKLHLAEIRDATIVPASFLATRGKAGRLLLTVRHGEKLEFEFENAVEMAKAIQALTPLLNSTLRINVEWNETKQQFQRKKTT